MRDVEKETVPPVTQGTPRLVNMVLTYGLTKWASLPEGKRPGLSEYLTTLLLKYYLASLRFKE